MEEFSQAAEAAFNDLPPDLRARVNEQDWEKWLRFYFPKPFSRPFTSYQRAFWEWGWRILPDRYYQPRVECEPRGVGKCLAGNTEILCADGVRREIQDITLGERIFSFNQTTGRFEVDFIRSKVHNGEQSCVTVKTKSGKSVTLTPEHRVLVFNGWKLASDLSLNDRIASPRRVFTEGSVERTGEEVRLLAYMIAEGATSSGNCNFTNADPIIVGDFYECANAMGFPVRGGVRYRHDLKAPGRQWARDVGLEGKRSFEKRIPTWVFNLPTQQKWMFLAAIIDTDGWISNHGRLGVTLANEKLVEDLMYLFMQVGVASFTKHRTHSERGAWELLVDQESLKTCAESLPLRLKGERLQGVLDKARYSLMDVYPNEIKYEYPNIGHWLRESGVARVDNQYDITRDKMRRMIGFEPVPRWVWLEQADVFWDEIVSIEDSGIEDTYDVEVLHNHNLITNGLVTHNSTNAECLVIALLARKRKQAIGYVSGTDDKATKHFNSIKRKLESETLLRDYPHLKPKVQKYRNAFNGWSQDRLITDGGQMIIPITLQGSNRGFKSEDDTRFDLIVLDDIDSLGESPDVVMKNIELLKSEIMLAGSANTTFIFAQNLIYRDSICSMVLDGRADMMTDREFVGPFPMMKWYDAEKMELPGGGKRWVITAGEVFDEAIPREYCESVLNQIGKDLFDRECQQDVTKVGDDKDFREWNEVYHVITQSEMVAGFPKVQMKDANGFFIPSRWHVGRGFDWGSTRAHPSSVCFVTRPDQTCPNDDCHFVFAEVVLPSFPYDPSIPTEQVSPGRVAAAVKGTERKFRLRDAQIEQSKMSHEASAAQSTLMLDLPDELQLFFKKWKAAKGSGVPQIQNMMEIDRTKEHPFRKFPKGHQREGQPLMGRPRIYFVVEDGQGELYIDGNGKLRITGAKDAGGFARARYELPLYNHRNAGQKKIDDDFVDSFRGLMAVFGVDADKLTHSEQLDALIPEQYKPETLKENYTYEREMSVNYQLAQAKKKLEPEVYHFNEALELEVDTWQ